MGQTRFRSKSARWPVPNWRSAPSGPEALGRVKIQFCQAVSRPKILVSSVSGPAKRWLASRPVSASGLKLARSSSAMRTSSSQSMSSGAKVTRPSSRGLRGLERRGRPRPRPAASPSGVAEEAGLQPGQPVAHRAAGRGSSGRP